MQAKLMIGAALIFLVVAAGFIATYRWFTASWRVLDDYELQEVKGLAAVMMRVRGWLRPGPRQLTYRRDQRGRFRRHKR
jgi:hypothetical protein